MSGIRVIDASRILAAPVCCQILGDFGADVIKVEHPLGGDPLRNHGHGPEHASLWWKEVGRNKRSVCIDLSDPRGAKILERLVATADVLVENFRPGRLEQWGLSPDRLLSLNPSLVMARISGFGQEGPYVDRPGFGTLAEAMSGFAHLAGFEDAPPTLPPFGTADAICGIAASSAVMMALYHREANGGSGQVIDLSILEPILAVAGPSPSIYDQYGVVEGPQGNRSPHSAPRNLYSSRDGRWVAVSASSLNVAERIMEIIGQPEICREPWFKTSRGRAQHADLLDHHIGEWISRRTAQEVIDAFSEVGAAAGRVYDARDVLQDPQVEALNMLPQVADKDLGTLRMHNVMWRMGQTPGQIRWTGPDLGAHTDEVLGGELGIPEGEIEELRLAGVIA